MRIMYKYPLGLLENNDFYDIILIRYVRLGEYYAY